MDLLRVLAMLMIVFNHLVYHGVQHVPAASAGATSQMSVHAVQANFLMLQFLAYSSLVATNIFFLITGYFLVKPREISYAVGKSFKLWRVIVFYSLTIYAGLCALGFLDFSWPQAIGQLMPIYSGNYWFMSDYLVVLLLSPFVARALDALAQREYLWLLILLLVINFAQGEWGYGNIFGGDMSLVFALSLFCLGGYLHKFGMPEYRFARWGYLAVYIGTCLLFTGFSYLRQVHAFVAEGQPMLLGSLARNSLPLLCSVCLFLLFSTRRFNIPGGISRLCVTVSPYVLAVYLIHDNGFFRSILWDCIVRPQDYLCSYWLIPYCLFAVVAIFASCVGIEYIRQRIAALF